MKERQCLSGKDALCFRLVRDRDNTSAEKVAVKMYLYLQIYQSSALVSHFYSPNTLHRKKNINKKYDKNKGRGKIAKYE